MQPSTDPTNGTVLQGVAWRARPGLRPGVPVDPGAPAPGPAEGQDPAAERARLERAVAEACAQIQELERQVAAAGHAAEAGVFGAHLQLVRDRALHRQAGAALAAGINAEAAWSDAVEAYAGRLAALPDPAFALRAADLRDVGRAGAAQPAGSAGRPGGARGACGHRRQGLDPSETVSLDPARILAFCTAEGGPTSHTAILAKALGLPAVVALGEAVLAIAPGTALWVDGAKGSHHRGGPRRPGCPGRSSAPRPRSWRGPNWPPPRARRSPSTAGPWRCTRTSAGGGCPRRPGPFVNTPGNHGCCGNRQLAISGPNEKCRSLR